MYQPWQPTLEVWATFLGLVVTGWICFFCDKWVISCGVGWRGGGGGVLCKEAGWISIHFNFGDYLERVMQELCMWIKSHKISTSSAGNDRINMHVRSHALWKLLRHWSRRFSNLNSFDSSPWTGPVHGPKLDLSHAYLYVLDKESQELLVLNTHQGFLKYKNWILVWH